MATKFTAASFKSFVRKNRENLFVKEESRFDGQVDCVMSVADDFSKAVAAEYNHTNNLGIAGVWLVGGGRDYFTPISEGGFVGYSVWNCCGSFIVAVKG